MVALVLMALCLNACVAAAIPALAGAALVRSGTNEENANEAQPAMAAPAPDSIAIAAPGLSDTVTLGPVPAPDMAPSPEATGSTGSIDAAPYLDLIAYALAPLTADGPRLSAALSNPAALNGKRKECSAGNRVVLIDLDPHKAQLSAASSPIATPELTAGLQSLRDAEVDIAWISHSSAAQAGDIREALQRSGLDPQSRDRLILMRYPSDRKQTRRTELAGEACLIAIAGDHREDFDELYEYLVKPEAALGLERLIGDGWFLVPPVFPPEGQTP
jgi:hypothetical protein